MKYNRFIETIVTKYFFLTAILLIVVTVGSVFLMDKFGNISIDKLSKIVDLTFKVIAILIGSLWALNRYYVSRVDFSQIKVDDSVHLIPKDKLENKNQGLLVYRFDIINTGTVLILPFTQYLCIEAVYLSCEKIKYKIIHKRKIQGFPIEPKSWSAINDVISISPEIKVIRIFLRLVLADGKSWTWHKTYDVS